MNFEEWSKRAEDIHSRVSDAYATYEKLKEEQHLFMKETLGVAPGEAATVLTTAGMISKIIDMKVGG